MKFEKGITEIARIHEDIQPTAGGSFSVVLLVLFQIGMAFAFLSGAQSAVQEAAVGTVWIAGNILLGLCVAVGRRRTYYVTRREPHQ
ncbi:MAG: hypothetical protein WCE79_10745 [Xanthobacteraceae bacterium]